MPVAPRRTARRVLDSGLCGTPWTTGARLGLERERVEAVASRPTITTADLDQIRPDGWFVARRADAAAARSRAEQLALLGTSWEETSVWTRVHLRLHLADRGPLAFVATVADFVYLGADLTDLEPGPRLVLGQPGPWFEPVRGTRLRTGPGRTWLLRWPDPHRVVGAEAAAAG